MTPQALLPGVSVLCLPDWPCHVATKLEAKVAILDVDVPVLSGQPVSRPCLLRPLPPPFMSDAEAAAAAADDDDDMMMMMMMMKLLLLLMMMMITAMVMSMMLMVTMIVMIIPPPPQATVHLHVSMEEAHVTRLVSLIDSKTGEVKKVRTVARSFDEDACLTHLVFQAPLGFGFSLSR